jgi:hypothetical protein
MRQNPRKAFPLRSSTPRNTGEARGKWLTGARRVQGGGACCIVSAKSGKNRFQPLLSMGAAVGRAQAKSGAKLPHGRANPAHSLSANPDLAIFDATRPVPREPENRRLTERKAGASGQKEDRTSTPLTPRTGGASFAEKHFLTVGLRHVHGRA